MDAQVAGQKLRDPADDYYEIWETQSRNIVMHGTLDECLDAFKRYAADVCQVCATSWFIVRCWAGDEPTRHPHEDRDFQDADWKASTANTTAEVVRLKKLLADVLDVHALHRCLSNPGDKADLISGLDERVRAALGTAVR